MAMMRQRRAGFTLVELMIALIAGAFAVAGVYYLNGMSSRMFGEQMRVSETQMSLRSAMEQLRREFSRAGYLHTPSSMVNPDCGGAFDASGLSTEVVAGASVVSAMQAIKTVKAPADAAVSALLAPNQTRADRVDIWGNFATADAYLVDPVGTTSRTQLYFQTGSESFRRSFADPSDGALQAARFRRVFAVGRRVRVEQEGRVFFRNITDNTTPFSVQIDALPSCFEPGRWSAVAPIVHYRYGLEPDTRPDLERLRPTSPSVGSRRALLVRREMNDAASEDTEMPNSARVVLDYAVEFAVDPIFDSKAREPKADDPAPTWEPEWTSDPTGMKPLNYRSLIVTLSSRSAEADPNLPSVGRGRFGQVGRLDSALMTFRVADATAPDAVLNARVRTMRSEIFLQNL